MRAMSIVGLSPHLQLMRSLQAASICRALGLNRKFSFLLRLAAIQCSDLHSYQAAHSLARVAASSYGVVFVDDHNKAPFDLVSPSSDRKNPRNLFPPPPGGWACLQKHLLSDLIAFSTSARDIVSSRGHYLTLLQLLGELDEQRIRAALISQQQYESTPPSSLVGGPPSATTRPRLTLDTAEINAEGVVLPRSASSALPPSTGHSRHLSRDSDSDDDENETEATSVTGSEDMTARRQAALSVGWQATKNNPRKATGAMAFMSHNALRFSFSGRSRGMKNMASRRDDSLALDDTQSGSAGSIENYSVLPQNIAAPPEEQETLILEMMKLTRRLPPEINLNVGGFPTVHYVRPLRLQGDFTPVERPVYASTSGPSAFLYNPFANKAAGVAPIMWVADEVCQVVLSLSNPLGAPLFIQSVELVLDKGEGSMEAFCYPLTLWIPAYRHKHDLTLSLKPLRSGEVLIKGLKLTVFNITTLVEVDEKGNGPKQPFRSTPRDCYPRRVPYSRQPGDKKKSSTAQDQPDLSVGLPVPINHATVVAPLPKLTSKLDKWATNMELFPGELRRGSVELQVRTAICCC